MNTIQSIERKFNRFSMREKILALVTIFFSIYFVMDRFFIESNLIVASESMENWQNQKILHRSVESEIESVQERLNTVPSLKKEQIEKLEAENKEIRKNIEKIQKDLIGATEMITALKPIFENLSDIKILSFAPVGTHPVGKEDSSLFQHEFELIFEATYVEAVNFFEDMKHFEKPFFLERVDYKVIAFPKALVSVKFYSLSDSSEIVKF